MLVEESIDEDSRQTKIPLVGSKSVARGNSCAAAHDPKLRQKFKIDSGVRRVGAEQSGLLA
jgi:hypothetical protein